MVRKLSWLVALLALCCSASVFALGLGDIDLHSALNQPLKAEIGLVSVQAGEVPDIKVSLGSADDFAHAGIDRPYQLTQLRFAVAQKGKGRYVIRVSTDQRVREPFLDFLIQVTWKGGQLLREYTVLLDPPVLMPAPTPVITAPVSKRATRTAPTPEPAAAAPAATAPSAAAAPSAPAAGDTYGPVRRNDTLWGIANRTRPDASVSVEQMMQALLRKNPAAFIDNNVNNLKAGQILRIPPQPEIEAMTPEQARRATHEQNVAWRNRRTAAAPAPQPAAPQKTQEKTQAPATPAATRQKPAPAKPQPEAAQPPSVPPPAEQGQLKLVAPKPEETAKPSAGGATPAAAPASKTTPTAPAAAGDEIHKEIALANEAVETQRQETQDLRNRLTDLEQQITTMQKLIKLKDQQLAGMQGQNRAAGQQGALAILDNPATLAMIGIVAAVLAALLWIAIRRRQLSVPVPSRDVRAEARSTPAPAAPAAMATPVRAAAAAGAGMAAAAARTAARDEAPARTEAVPHPPHADADPLSEADIYLAYGRYQQAEELIKEAMSHDRRPELKVKLLEIYYAAKNATAFEDAAGRLRDDIGTEHALWQQTVAMGRELCPYSTLFAAAGGGGDLDLGDLKFADEQPAGTPPAQVDLDLDAAEAGGDMLDEVGTKLDLARAYIDMGDPTGARSILDEVMQEGSEQQRSEAQQLLKRIAQ